MARSGFTLEWLAERQRRQRRTDYPGPGAANARPGALAALLEHRPRRGMNRTEASYGELLDLRVRAGELVDWRFQAFRLRLADGAFYTPDFALVLDTSGRLTFHETKGFMREAARVRVRVAAALHPWWPFVIVRRAEGGGWTFENVPVDAGSAQRLAARGAAIERGAGGSDAGE